ncbi:hypothetical protein [Sphingorhabdus sp.]|uniref:hypothetical protein n=1 Tax=Sphingorhabdus sp. TaxID=1902408 RepID=UPI00391B82E7
MQIRHLTLIAIMALAACVAPPPQPAPKTVSAPPPVVVTPTPEPRLAGDWNDWPFTPGNWTYSRDGRGSMGAFGAPGRTATVSLRCDAQSRRVYLAREASAPGQRMVIRTSTAMKEFIARAVSANTANIAAEILPNDPILDAMAFSRGRVLVEAEGQQPVILPSWAEITRIVEDCRG